MYSDLEITILRFWRKWKRGLLNFAFGNDVSLFITVQLGIVSNFRSEGDHQYYVGQSAMSHPVTQR